MTSDAAPGQLHQIRFSISHHGDLQRQWLKICGTNHRLISYVSEEYRDLVN
jgi:hypothetical protein